MTIAVKSYVLTAASGSMADIMNALISHFTSAPAYWQLKPAVTNSVAGQAFVITQKLDPTTDINVRATSTTAWAVVSDPGKTIINCGNSSSAPTGASANAAPERTFTSATAMARGVYVIELQRAIYIICHNATYTAQVRGIFGGQVYTPISSDYIALGADGHGCSAGIPAYSGSAGSWMAAVAVNSESSACLIRSGRADWWGLGHLFTNAVGITQATVFNPGVTNDVVLQPFCVMGYHTSLGVRTIGVMDHMFLYPIRTGITQAQLPRTIAKSATEEWLFLNSTAANSQLVIVWEPGVIPTKP